MAEEMKESIVGPMPPQEFLDEFFPTDSINSYGHGVVGEFYAGCYNGAVNAGLETRAYDPFVSP